MSRQSSTRDHGGIAVGRAGFASTIFWPITITLHNWFTWQQTYLLFACLHLFLCVPVHLLLARSIAKSGRKRSTNGTVITAFSSDLPAHQRRKGFVLILVAFSTQALVAAAILVHMVPMLGALGLAGSAAFIGAIFGPSQVASRLINMLGGKNLAPISLAVISASLMGLALIVLLFGAPSIVATMMFACLFGFGNGLFSIISGTLPLSLFGSDGYGAMQDHVSQTNHLGHCSIRDGFRHREYRCELEPIHLDANSWLGDHHIDWTEAASIVPGGPS